MNSKNTLFILFILFCSAEMLYGMETTAPQSQISITKTYETAKNGSLTNEAASTIIYHFLQTDIASCISNFDDTFDKAFPKEIMKHGNDNRLYQMLTSSLSRCWSVKWTINDNASLFSIEDFESKKSKEEIIECAASRYFDNENFINACKEGFIILSPCEDFLAFSRSKSLFGWFEIHNLKTKDKIVLIFPHILSCSNGKVAFSRDNSCLGILDSKGKIHSIALKQLLDIPFKKMAFSAYYYHKLRDTDTNLLPFLKSIVSNQIKNKEMPVETISDVVQAHTELLPAYICNSLEEKIEEIKCARSLIDLLTIASITLHMTTKEIALKLFYKEHQDYDQPFEERFLNSVRNKLGNDDFLKSWRDIFFGVHPLRVTEFLEKNQ